MFHSLETRLYQQSPCYTNIAMPLYIAIGLSQIDVTQRFNIQCNKEQIENGQCRLSTSTNGHCLSWAIHGAFVLGVVDCTMNCLSIYHFETCVHVPRCLLLTAARLLPTAQHQILQQLLQPTYSHPVSALPTRQKRCISPQSTVAGTIGQQSTDEASASLLATAT